MSRPQIFDTGKRGLRSFTDCHGNLQDPADTVSCGEDARETGIHLFVDDDPLILKPDTKFPCEIATLRSAECHEKACRVNLRAVFQTDSLQCICADKFQNRCLNDRNFRWEVNGRFQPVGQKRDGVDDREKFLDFMKGVLAISKDGDRLTAVEKRLCSH